MTFMTMYICAILRINEYDLVDAFECEILSKRWGLGWDLFW